jgi:hypothetical protein
MVLRLWEMSCSWIADPVCPAGRPGSPRGVPAAVAPAGGSLRQCPKSVWHHPGAETRTDMRRPCGLGACRARCGKPPLGPTLEPSSVPKGESPKLHGVVPCSVVAWAARSQLCILLMTAAYHRTCASTLGFSKEASRKSDPPSRCLPRAKRSSPLRVRPKPARSARPPLGGLPTRDPPRVTPKGPTLTPRRPRPKLHPRVSRGKFA